MAQQLLINVILAFVWMFLADSFSGSSFVIGYLLGFGIIFVLRRYFSTTFYAVPLFVIGKLALIFIKDCSFPVAGHETLHFRSSS